ncbi:GNAT family N-acetyltransferase [bacterium]|nr:GNAT family N-acetyltransferase [bacterium]
MKIDVRDFERRIVVRPLDEGDYEQLVELQKACFPKMLPWSIEQFQSLLTRFKEGQICIELDGELIASSSSLIVDYDLYSDWHDWWTISSGGTLTNHNPNGDMLYGIEMMVHPECRGRKLARRLYDARKQLVREQNLKGIVIGGRIPGYSAVADEMGPHEYVQKVQEKQLHDPVLTAQLANGFEVKRLLKEYLPTDEDSVGWATHMEWTNLDFRPFKKRSIQAVQMVRLAAVQYQMRAISGFAELERQIEYFVDTASDYHADFLLFPELFSTQALSFMKVRGASEGARKLAEYTPRYVELFADLALKYNLNIVAGSQFVLDKGKLYNVAYLFRRDGTIEEQYKIHVTPAEWRWWGVVGGNKVNVFDTDCGRVAILICYDVEFPELARIAVKKGAQLIFCPFNTNERNGYLRVRHSAIARCIENHVYTVIAGCTGNLPQAEVADMHYAQSGIYTPADVCFSRDCVAAESTPNIETLIVHDVDLEMLRRHRYTGTTRNWLDRRRDLYEVRYKEDGGEFSV